MIITLAKHRRTVFWSIIFIICLPLTFNVWVILQFESCNLSPDINDHNIDFTNVKSVGMINNILNIIENNGFIHIIENPIGFYDKKEQVFRYPVDNLNNKLTFY